MFISHISFKYDNYYFDGIIYIWYSKKLFKFDEFLRMYTLHTYHYHLDQMEHLQQSTRFPCDFSHPIYCSELTDHYFSLLRFSSYQ